MLIYKLYHFAIDFSSKLVILILSKICSFKIFSLVALHISWINSIIVNTTVLRASTVLRLKHYSCWPCLVKTLGCAMRWRREEQSVFEILLWESHQSENSLLSSSKTFTICFLETSYFVNIVLLFLRYSCYSYSQKHSFSIKLISAKLSLFV